MGRFRWVTGILFVAVHGCAPVIDVEPPSAGQASFERYIAIGSGYTAGYNDGALHRTGQLNSYPNMLAEQFRTVGGGSFNIPLTPDVIGFDVDGSTVEPKLELGFRSMCNGDELLTPVRLESSATPENFDYIGNDANYHNFGIPWLRVTDMFRITLSDPIKGNPYYIRFAPDTLDHLINVLARRKATFFTVWMGMDDLLLFAQAGGEGPVITGGEQFATSYNAMILALIADSAQGVVANIPDILRFPFFTTIAYDGLILSEEKAATFNDLAQQAGLNWTFNIGRNLWRVEDLDEPEGWRFIQEGELVLNNLPPDSVECALLGSFVPLPDRFVLDSSEVAAIHVSLDFYNSIISFVAGQHNLGLVDMHAWFQNLEEEIQLDGLHFSDLAIEGDFYSLDHTYPTDRGHALIATEFIKVINTHYGAALYEVDPTVYNGNLYP